jgi:transcriptional regulator with XRE-family HTH domain
MHVSSYQLTKSERKAMAKRLQAARFLAKKTVRGTADEMGVSPASISQWLSGTVPVPESRVRLAEIYGVSEEVLFAEVIAHEAEARKLLSA